MEARTLLDLLRDEMDEQRRLRENAKARCQPAEPPPVPKPPPRGHPLAAMSQSQIDHNIRQQYEQMLGGLFGQAQAGSPQQQYQQGAQMAAGWSTTDNAQYYNTTVNFSDSTGTTPVAVRLEPAPSKTPNQDWLDQRINEIRIAL